jgi:hypothetical protein
MVPSQCLCEGFILATGYGSVLRGLQCRYKGFMLVTASRTVCDEELVQRHRSCNNLFRRSIYRNTSAEALYLRLHDLRLDAKLNNLTMLAQRLCICDPKVPSLASLLGGSQSVPARGSRTRDFLDDRYL